MESTLIWAGTILLAAGVLLPYLRRFESQRRQERERHREAVGLGSNRPTAQYPLIDEMACIGCGGCVTACPEGDVLGVSGGRAVIVNGLRCVGHGACAEACPVGAIRVGLGDIRERDDLPLLDPWNETSVPGLFIAGELSGYSLILNAVRQGSRVVDRIAERAQAASGRPAAAPRPSPNPADPPLLDLIIVGAGPAGLSAALAARKHRLRYLVIDQQEPGGTILQYPRKKLVLSQPVELPLYGRLEQSAYRKEELLKIWWGIIKQFEIPIRTGEKVEAIEREGDGFRLRSTGGVHRAAAVVLALGRRGSPRKLGIPGEDREKVMYRLIDAESFQGQNLLIVGGGDSAVEAAVGLARQPGNQVTLSYRKERLFRVRQRNADNFAAACEEGRLRPLFASNLLAIGERNVRIRTKAGEEELANDYTFIFAGGDPPLRLLQASGVLMGGTSPKAEIRPPAGRSPLRG